MESHIAVILVPACCHMQFSLVFTQFNKHLTYALKFSAVTTVFTRVVTSCNAGLPFALLLLLLLLLFVGRICSEYCILTNFTMLSAYCNIASLFPGSLSRQPFPAVLPLSLAPQPCPAAFFYHAYIMGDSL
jgi:hypothetical protein